jgi:hypothetical protein
MCVRYEDKTDALSTALEEKICCAVNAAPNECLVLLLLLTRSLILLSLFLSLNYSSSFTDRLGSSIQPCRQPVIVVVRIACDSVSSP